MCRMPARCAAMVFSLTPPMGSTRPVSESSPVIAKSARGDIGPAVILHNLFDPSLPRDGSSFFTDLENEVRGECAKHGEIISVEAQPTAGSRTNPTTTSSRCVPPPRDASGLRRFVR